jgi:hypothetical protein
MPVQLPAPAWPPQLLEAGPPEDPFILLSGPARIGEAPYRVLAVRINPNTLGIDYRYDLGEDVYADYQLEDMLDEFTFLDEINKSVLVPIEQGHYVIWMLPSGDPDED